MNQRNPKNNASPGHGLSLSGTIIDRTRRMVPRDNPTTEIVTYTIQDGYNRKFSLKKVSFIFVIKIPMYFFNTIMFR